MRIRGHSSIKMFTCRPSGRFTHTIGLIVTIETFQKNKSVVENPLKGKQVFWLDSKCDFENTIFDFVHVYSVNIKYMIVINDEH